MNDANANSSFMNNLVTTLDEMIPVRAFDDSVGSTIYQVNHAEEWTEVTEAVFRSWTGLRMINGEPYHGPIYNFGTDGNSSIYNGSRACSCGVCQSTVDAKLKSN